MMEFNISIYRKGAIKYVPDQFRLERVSNRELCLRFEVDDNEMLIYIIYQSPFLWTTIMPKRRRGDRSDNEVETVTFTIPEYVGSDYTLSSLMTTPTASTMFTPPLPELTASTMFTLPLPEQVINVSEWTVGTDRVSTSNALFSTTFEPAPSTSLSFNNPDHHLHIPGTYYDVVDVSDFQPPPEPLQPSQSSNTESSKNSKARSLFSFSPIVI
jgi:hypothetical protein